MAVTTMCRICMTQELNIQLFKPFSQEIINMIEFCTGVLLQPEDEDGLPSQICIQCLTDLHVAHKFKMKCVHSDKAYQKLTKCNRHIEDETELETSNRLELESCMEYDVSNDTGVMSEDMLEEIVCDQSIVKRNNRGAVSKVKLSRKKEKKIVVRRKNITCGETKVNSRRGANKFRRLYCEPCQLPFTNRKESLEHKKKLHKEEKSWICEVCGKSYAHRSSQIAHMHSHYPARYACHDCDYSTYNKYDLIKHVRIHTGDKCYKCTQCTAAYRTSSNLRTHVRLMHERMRAHACHICGKTYNDRATLNRHIDAHNDIKRHVCEVCHSCFSQRCYWKKHLQKQHDIVIPSCRPGRPKAEVLLVERSDKGK